LKDNPLACPAVRYPEGVPRLNFTRLISWLFKSKVATASSYLGSKIVASRVGTLLSYIMQDHQGSTTGSVGTDHVIASTYAITDGAMDIGGMLIGGGAIAGAKELK
jgi:hypothetical protein